MGIKETVVFSSLVALAVWSFNVLDTDAAFSSEQLSAQWNQVKNDLIKLDDDTKIIGLKSQTLKDAIEEYWRGNTDYTPVAAAIMALGEAKTNILCELNDYYRHTLQFEANGVYNVATNPYRASLYPNIFQGNQMRPSFYPGSGPTNLPSDY